MQKSLVIIVVKLLFLVPFYLFAQDKSYIPPSPTAASLGKYGDIPVSNYTGVPSINIPLYTINTKNISLPISLSYHASGIRVDDEASWVGLGWSLQAGGVITRTVRGRDDLPSEGVNYTPYPNYIMPLNADSNNDYVPPPNPSTNSQFLREVGDSGKDVEPDVFYFNFAGHSGKFFIQQRQTVNSPYSFIVESQEKMKIELFPPSYNKGWSWVFTTGDGVKYYFGTEEKSRGYNGVSEVLPVSPTGPYLGEEELYITTSSWYLDQIVSPNGESIDFVYTSAPSYGSRRTKSLSEERMYNIGTEIHNQTSGCSPEGPPPYHKYFSSFSVVFDVYLKEINFNGGKVDFQISDRDDIQPMGTLGQKAKKLDKITISSLNQINHSLNELKSFQFGYDYFTSIDSYINMGYPSGQNVDPTYSGKRLRLNSLTEKIGLVSQPPYEFSYHQTSYVYGNIPNKYSLSKDHWGFFNNAFNGNVYDSPTKYVPTLIPPFLDVNQSKYYNGADREANEEQIILGTIKQIKYPTGGTTSFEFESNDYSNFPDQNKVQKSTRSIAVAGSSVNYPEYYIDPDTEAETLLTVSKTTVLKVSAHFSYSEEHCSGSNPGYGGTGGISIRNDTNTPFFLAGAVPTTTLECYSGETVFRIIVLPPGTYKIKAEAENHVISSASLTYEEETNDTLMEKKGGGIRIAKITDYNGIDHSQDKVTTFKYTHLDNMGRERSSGVLMTPLAYAYQMQYKGSRSCGGNGYGVSWTTTYLKRTSGSTISLGMSAQGSAVGYSQVTILNSLNGEQGQTVLNYYNQAEQLPSTFFPNIPNQPGPINGILKKKTIYKSNSQSSGSTMLKVNETSWEYTSDVSKRKVAKGVKCMGCENMYQAMLQGIPYIPIVKFYDSVSEWWRPISETTITYDGNGSNPLSKTINYYYDNPEHMQVTRNETLNSDNKIQTTVNIYPEDYSGITSGFIASLRSNHIVKKPIEQVILLKENANATPKVISGKIMEYDGNGLERKILSIDEGEIIDGSVFKFSNVEPGNLPFSGTPPAANFITDTRYKEKVKLHPDGSFGNVLMVEPATSYPVSYIWGYLDQYPIAECKNALYTNIFYEGFEQGNYSNQGAYTGKRSYLGAYNSTISGIDDGKYELAYRTKSGDNWVFYQTQVNVSGNAYTIDLPYGTYDDIRFYPVGALMTTYTYEPLVGMTSMTDARGMTTYYDYDGFGRLVAIRDKDRNVIKQICYNYAGQPTNCILPAYTVPDWGPTGNTRCLKNAFDVNTGYQEREERDKNPESPSYNQIRWVDNGISTSCPIPPQTYSNVEISDDFVKQGCAYTDGSIVKYTVPAGTYFGSSQAEANDKAESDLLDNGQNYANANGTCPIPDAYISAENLVWTYQGTMADLVLYFYDPNTSEPIYVNNMPISYTQYGSCSSSGSWSNPKSMTVSGSSLMLESYVALNYWYYIPDPWGGGGMITEDCEYMYTLDPSQFYNAY
jgi:YD repeat-containing protein